MPPADPPVDPPASTAAAALASEAERRSPPIDPRRYRKLRRFILRVLLHAFWWEVVMARRPLRRLRTPAVPRWQGIARRYRTLAIEMGGVLIKLGQFLSTRVDVLPREIVGVLADLQDEVPPAPFDEIVEQIEADLGRPLGELYAEVEPRAVGAASLAQVHAARLADGRRAVVKALRPGIEVLVETDLAAVGVAIRWLRLWRPVRRRVDLRRLIREFAQTTRRELDMRTEARSAERFAENFADDPQVRIPGIFHHLSGSRTLTMEDVSFLKIADHAALEAAGIDRSAVAAKLFRTYLEQIFAHNFVHADPHPGNIFVEPLDGAEAGVDGGSGRPFRLVFVDFGMTAQVPDRLRQAMSEFLIAFGTRDTHRIVQAAVDAGVLLPEADLVRLEEVHEDLFERFWGVSLGDLRETALGEARYFLSEYWDLAVELPFQVPTELLFVGRALGLLAGMAISLDRDFDPWAETLPFARRLASGELTGAGQLFDQVVEQGRLIVRLPSRADRFLTSAQRGELSVRAAFAPDAMRSARRIERGLKRLYWMVAAGALLVAGATLLAAWPGSWAGPGLLAGSGLAFALSLFRRR